jgi:hypothetical protein
MFALDSREVLTKHGVRFSDKNMQLGTATTAETEQFFGTIPFEKVFSEGVTGGDRSYTDARCAEVLATSPLALVGCLQEIYFRSEPERDTLLHAIGELREEWAPRCYVSDTLKLFEKSYAFVQEVALTPKGITFAFNERRDRRALHVCIEVVASDGTRVIDFEDDAMPARPPNAQRWIVEKKLIPGVYLARITLEGHLAYEAAIPLIDVVF